MPEIMTSKMIFIAFSVRSKLMLLNKKIIHTKGMSGDKNFFFSPFFSFLFSLMNTEILQLQQSKSVGRERESKKHFKNKVERVAMKRTFLARWKPH